MMMAPQDFHGVARLTVKELNEIELGIHSMNSFQVKQLMNIANLHDPDYEEVDSFTLTTYTQGTDEYLDALGRLPDTTPG